MANWIKIKNNVKVDLGKIPIISVNNLRDEVKSIGKRPVGFFGKDWAGYMTCPAAKCGEATHTAAARS